MFAGGEQPGERRAPPPAPSCGRARGSREHCDPPRQSQKMSWMSALLMETPHVGHRRCRVAIAVSMHSRQKRWKQRVRMTDLCLVRHTLHSTMPL